MEATAVRTTEYEISDADAIEQFLVDAYGTSMRIRGGNDRHLLRHRRTDAGALAVEAAYQSADLEFSVEPLNKIVVTRTSTSRLERAGDGADRRYGVGELFVMSDPDRPYMALRRTIAFIDENAHTGITTADIAGAAFVTIRAVQLAFRRHMDTTPMSYLRRVRIDHAHRDLLAADPGHKSVTAIAYRWGFSSPSRFAAAYRQAYGVTPAQTLHQG